MGHGHASVARRLSPGDRFEYIARYTSYSIYRHPRLYRLAMRAAYRSEYAERYARVAAQITAPSRVVELCCGDLRLHDHLARRGLLASYRGVDLNPSMVAHGQRRGISVQQADVRTLIHIPPADVVVMQASLYQFHGTAESLLRRLWQAAGRQLIIAEPVRNLSSSRNPLVRRIGTVLSRTDEARHPFRYTACDLVELYARAGVPMTQMSHTSHRREVVISSVKDMAPARAPLCAAIARPRLRAISGRGSPSPASGPAC